MKITVTPGIYNRQTFRAWLAANHARAKECWIAVKRGRPAAGMFAYLDAVEEALCFGWIDSTTKRQCGGDTLQRFSPRRPGSAWSELNKARCRRLIGLGLMTPAGAAVLPDLSPEAFRPDPEVVRALQANAAAWKHFCRFPRLYQCVRLDTIQIKKSHPALFAARLQKLIEASARGGLFGLWHDYGRLLPAEMPASAARFSL